MKLTILVENSVAMPFLSGVRGGLLGEHGLSVLIEGEMGRWLYDTGRSKALLPNLEVCEIAPDSLDGVILSHGHLDHVSGLKPLLEARTKPLKVYCHPGIFITRFNKKGDLIYEVGMQQSQKELEALGAEFHFNEDLAEIAPRMWLSGRISRRNPVEKIREPFFLREQGELVPDLIWDEQALILEGEAGLTVLTGCAHSGVVSILERVKELLPEKKIWGVMGGLHLLNAGSRRLELTISALKEIAIGFVAVGHCTGFQETAAIAAAFPEVFHNMNAGMSFEI